MSKKDFEEEFENVDDEDFDEDDFDEDDFDEDDDFDDDEDFDDEEEDVGEYAPTRDIIAKLLREDKNCVLGNKDYVEEAAAILERWYREEHLLGLCLFDDEEDFLDNGYWDLCELVEGQSAILDADGARECHIVWMALEGHDPHEEEK